MCVEYEYWVCPGAYATWTKVATECFITCVHNALAISAIRFGTRDEKPFMSLKQEFSDFPPGF